MTTPDSFIHGVWPQMFLIRVFFGLVIAAAAWTDVRSRRIPNLLLLYAAFPGGFLLGPVFLFRLRLTGAGDVKLLAVAAAWAGPALFFRFCFLSLLAAFIPSAVLFLRGRRGARIPMGPFFLAGWASANCTVLLNI